MSRVAEIWNDSLRDTVIESLASTGRDTRDKIKQIPNTIVITCMIGRCFAARDIFVYGKVSTNP